MPVERFRTFEDADRAGWTGEATLAARMAWALAWTHPLARETPFRGVKRFRTFGEANRERERRIQERVDALRRERGTG